MPGTGAAMSASPPQRPLPIMRCPMEIIPPPSYVEAMAQDASSKGAAVPPAQQTYDHYPQVCSLPIPDRFSQDHFCPGHGCNPATQNPSVQQNPGAPIRCIVHTEHVVHRKRRGSRASNKIICAGMLGIVIMIVVIRMILIRSGV